MKIDTNNKETVKASRILSHAITYLHKEFVVSTPEWIQAQEILYKAWRELKTIPTNAKERTELENK